MHRELQFSPPEREVCGRVWVALLYIIKCRQEALPLRKEEREREKMGENLGNEKESRK
jgi:hypothetical protein